MHGKSKQRTWKKIHLAINHHTQGIEAVEVTDNSCGDSQMVKPLLSQIEAPIAKAIADGGYDSRPAYALPYGKNKYHYHTLQARCKYLET